MLVWENIGSKNAWDYRNGMILYIVGRWNSMGGVKNSLVLGEYILEVEMHKWFLNILNIMELGNNARMTFSEEHLNSKGTSDLRGAFCDALELILMSYLWELHGHNRPCQ